MGFRRLPITSPRRPVYDELCSSITSFKNEPSTSVFTRLHDILVDALPYANIGCHYKKVMLLLFVETYLVYSFFGDALNKFRFARLYLILKIIALTPLYNGSMPTEA